MWPEGLVVSSPSFNFLSFVAGAPPFCFLEWRRDGDLFRKIGDQRGARGVGFQLRIISKRGSGICDRGRE